eukprot:5120620-Ditylum_brightwellii.AAC.1
MGSSSLLGITHQEMTKALKAIEAHPVFQGKVTINLVTNHLLGGPFHPEWLEGQFYLCPDSLPSVAAWVYVDAILIHVPTKELCSLALSFLLDTLVRLGIQ